MHAIDRFEKLGRLILWVVISGVLVVGFAVVPLQMVAHAAAESELREELEDAKERLEEARDPDSERLPLEGMGTYISGLDHRNATGMVWFTNVSPRSGVVCVEGTATNDESGESTTSLASCSQVEPYQTVEMKLMFAGGPLDRVCPKRSGCTFSISEVDDAPQGS
ncbi:MAG: hypothetical protein ACODAU_03230 [Myxococcota bacterium]